MIISIDFDGTIVEENYPGIGALKPGAIEVLMELSRRGHYLILNTCRAGEDLLTALNFCLGLGIVFNRVNDNNPEMTAAHYPTRKVYADIYIDDHNLGGFPGWYKTLDIIDTAVEFDNVIR